MEKLYGIKTYADPAQMYYLFPIQIVFSEGQIKRLNKAIDVINILTFKRSTVI